MSRLDPHAAPAQASRPQTDDIRSESAPSAEPRPAKQDLWSALSSSLEFQAGAPPLRPVPRKEPLPLSWAQERLWLIQQGDPNSPVYNLAFAWRLTGALDVPALDQSLAAIVDRHEVFRTVFAYKDNQPVQSVSGAPWEGLRIIDFSRPGEGEEKARIEQWLACESRRPFDLTRGPLLRASLLRLHAAGHVLLLTMHHIVCDAASLDVLFAELRDFYAGFVGGEPAAVRPLPVQYADFAAWQRGWVDGAALERQVANWRARLGGRLAAVSPPPDRPRPVKPSFRGALLPFKLPGRLRAQLERLRHEEGVTNYNLFLAAFKALLHRYTGETDIVIGSLTANRNRPELRPLIGFFANTLVLRTTVVGERTFRELLGDVRQTVLEACANQDVPFQLLVKELGRSRDSGASPFFDVMFSYQSIPKRGLELPGLCARMLPVDNGTSKFDLTLVVNESAEGFDGWIEFSTDLFDAPTVERMAQHYRNLLSAAATHPDLPLWSLPVLSEAERRRMLVTWNNTSREFDRARCVHQLVEEQAARTPDETAILFNDRRLSYRELEEKAAHLAAHLQTLGVARGNLVGILMDRSPEMVVALLAVLKTGAAYVPLDPSYPKHRLTFMIGDANLAVLLTHSHFETLPEVPGRRIVLVDRVLAAPAPATRRKSRSPTDMCDSSDVMYVIYTSGSTGSPKGVQVSHRSVVNFLASMRKRPGLAPADRLLALTTISFDIAVLELFLPLTVGAQVVIAPAGMALARASLAAEIERRGVTIMQATPAAWRLLVESGWSGCKRLKALCGGESLSPELAVKLLERCGELWNLYGPTETTIWSALHRVERVDGPVPIGRPIANTQLYVLDARLQPVPVGVEGELFIGGEGLARGYLNQPELTGERFIANPFGRPGSRLYRTGDRARFLRDGNLVCLGRSDHQVKIRGFRIELGEIESLLEQHPGVNAAVVAADNHGGAGGRLLAYWIPNPSRRPAAPELRKFMEKRLPAYMIPSGFMELAEFPLTPNGKVDRARLPRPVASRECVESPCAPAEGSVEMLLTQIWKEVLDQQTIGVHDDFFELGGHSLSMMQVLSRINASLRVQLPVAAFLECPTIARLAEAISKNRRD